MPFIKKDDKFFYNCRWTQKAEYTHEYKHLTIILAKGNHPPRIQPVIPDLSEVIELQSHIINKQNSFKLRKKSINILGTVIDIDKICTAYYDTHCFHFSIVTKRKQSDYKLVYFTDIDNPDFIWQELNKTIFGGET